MQLGELGGMLEIVYIDRRIGIFGILSIFLSDINYPDPCSHCHIISRCCYGDDADLVEVYQLTRSVKKTFKRSFI